MISLRYLSNGDWMLRHKRVESSWVNGRERVTTSVTETRLDENDMQDLEREIEFERPQRGHCLSCDTLDRLIDGEHCGFCLAIRQAVRSFA